MGNDNLSPDSVFKSRDSGMSVKMNSQLLIGAVIFLFLMVIFTFFIYVYAKTYWLPRMTIRRRAHFEFADGDAPVATRGLDPGVLRSLPVTIFSRSEFDDGLECSVCLCELSEGEEARLLPKCSHGFHLQCIDMWFHSHSTCPVCRCHAGPEASSSAETPPRSTASPASEHPLLSESQFSLNQGRVSAGGFSGHPDRSLVIAVPSGIAEGFNSAITPLGTMSSPAEVARSPGMSKFTTLRRLLSRAKSNGSSSCSSPIECDIEQQGSVRDGAINGERISISIIEN